MKFFKYFSFIFLSLAGTAYSATLSPDAKIQVIDDFSGGFNSTIPSHKLDKKFSPNTRNFFVHRNPQSLTKRNGFIIAGSTSVLQDIRFIFTFNKENGSKEFIVSDSSNVFSTYDFNSYVLISSGLTQSLGLSAAQVRNKVWLTNGNDPVFTWDGTVKQVLDGTKGLPNVPKFRYIAYWFERVWGLTTSADGSSLDFNSITVSTSGEIITPDDPRAWPPINRYEIGQGDGQVGTALWVYKGRLYIGKEHSIFVKLDSSISNAIRIDPQIGVVSNDSVVPLDDNTYFFGNPPGVYEFNGYYSKRISDNMTLEMSTVNVGFSQTSASVWRSRNDFDRGYYLAGTTPSLTSPNSVTMISTQAAEFKAGGGTVESFPGTLNSGTTSTGWIHFSNWASDFTPKYNFQGFLNNLDTNLICNPCGNPPSLTLFIRNFVNGVTEAFTKTTFNCDGSFGCGWQFSSTTTLFTGQDMLGSSIAFRLEYNSDVTHSNAGIGTVANWDFQNMFWASTANYVSDAATITAISNWGTFDVDQTLNNGKINYFIRTASSPVNIATQAWTSISASQKINLPTANNTFVQWASTIVAVSTVSFPLINSITINTVGGFNRDRPFATSWNREYWLSITTGSNNTSIQYVKAWNTNSNPYAWNPLYGQDVRSFAKNSESTFYGGSASSGTIFRLDYGNNDNGNPIDAYWDTPDFDFSDGQANSFMDKNIYETWIDVNQTTGGNFILGISTNNAPFSYNSFSINGSGRMLKFIKTPNIYFNTLRLRLENNELNKPLLLHKAAIVYTPTQIRSQR